jgi:hypothetical protein
MHAHVNRLRSGRKLPRRAPLPPRPQIVATGQFDLRDMEQAEKHNLLLTLKRNKYRRYGTVDVRH